MTIKFSETMTDVYTYLDSMRESYKFRDDDWAQADPSIDPRTSVQFKMRLFRAQRNIYITGFALFLLL